MTVASQTLQERCVNTIRGLAMDAVQKAKSGHPGAPMGAAPMAFALWAGPLRHNPANPGWVDRDRFVLSAGHASMLLYGLLHLTGYRVSLDDLKSFRQWGSNTPGHPEYGDTPGVEATTGPLGQGFAMGVGMAIAERHLAARFNRPGHTIVDHHTYAIVSDGDLMEGVASEAASLAGTLGLGRLIYLYDDNQITIEGDTDLAFREDVPARFAAYNWHVQCIDGSDVAAVAAALDAARAETRRPSLIVARTVIAEGSPNKAGTADAHGAPLGEDEVALTKEALGLPDEPFFIPEDALEEFRKAVSRGEALEREWQERFDAYAAAFPGEAAAFRRAMSGELPHGWQGSLPAFSPEDGDMATRSASGKVLNAIAPVIDNLVGGSADLAPSNNTYLKDYPDFAAETPEGRNFRFGVREHAMGATLNGMALHGGLIPYGGTFLIFSDYMRPAIRLAALMGTRTIFVLTHDSIGLGEDGPTHQPVEHLASLRAIPNLTVLRPADANETVGAWKVALEATGPVAIALSRQNLPIVSDAVTATNGVTRGAYVLADSAGGPPSVILIATGSEVSLALEARARLQDDGIPARVVSMPSWDRFAAQDVTYRESVLPRHIRARVSVEAGSSLGWERYTGDAGVVIGLDRFGASAPYKTALANLGFTVEAVCDAARQALASAGEG